MKSHQRGFQSALALGLVVSMTLNPFYSPRAYANQKSEFHEVCDPINQGGVKADGSSNGGDQAKGECAKAELAMNATKGEKTKFILYTAMAVVAGAGLVMTYYPVTLAAGKAMCKYSSYGSAVGGMIANAVTSSANSEVVSKFTKASSQVLSAAGTAVAAASSGLLGEKLTPKFLSNSTVASTSADGKTEMTKGERNACILTVAVLGAQAGISGKAWGDTSKAFNNSIFAAKSLRASSNTAVTQIALNGPNANNGGGVSANPKPNGSNPVISETCDEKGGNEYIRCMGQISPELSAITSNPDFVGTMEKALGGKSLGDFAKGFKGETPQEAANYIGSALGVSGDSVAKLMDDQQKLAQETGAMEKYEPLAYTRSGGSSSHVSDKAPDFSKIMSDMLKQMNPDADGKKEDPSELVFRQMDLLPAEKIEQNKDISLFARIGYRYRKNLVNVEQLNWSRAENQQSTQRQPASP